MKAPQRMGGNISAKTDSLVQGWPTQSYEILYPAGFPSYQVICEVKNKSNTRLTVTNTVILQWFILTQTLWCLPYFVLLMLCGLEERQLIICSSRVGCASCSDGKRAPTPRTVHFGRTSAPSGGSWSCRKPTETRSTRKSPDSSTLTGCTLCFTPQTRWYKHRPASQCSQSVTSRFDFPHYKCLRYWVVLDLWVNYPFKSLFATAKQTMAVSKTLTKVFQHMAEIFKSVCLIPPPAPLSYSSVYSQ